MSRTTPFARRAAVSAAAGALALTVTACGSAAGGGQSTGFHDLQYASGEERAALCDGLLGTPEQIGDRLDLSLTFVPDNVEGCSYDNGSPDHFLVFAVDDEEPTDATLYGRGEAGYFVAMSTTDTYDADRSADLVEWLRDAADAVTDDYDQWLADLPALDPGTVVFDAELDDQRVSADSGDGQLLTPGGVVRVGTVDGPPDFVLVDGAPVRAADGEQLTAADVIVLPFDGSDGEPVEQSLEFRAGSVALTGEASMDPGVPDQRFVVASAPAADPVTVQVTTGDAAQSIELGTGRLDDEGLGQRLAAGRYGRSVADRRFEDVDLQLAGANWCCNFWSGPYQVERWTVMPWTVAAGWAPQGTSFLELDLETVTGESVQFVALTADDVTATVDGKQYPATAFDPDTLVYRFEVPQGAEDVQVQIALTPDPQRYMAGRSSDFTWSGQPLATVQFAVSDGDPWFDGSTNRLHED